MKNNFEEEFSKIGTESNASGLESCEIDNCEVDDNVALGTYEEVIKDMIMPPSKSGMYFSRLDLKRVALLFGESIIIDERKRMIRKILDYIDSKENLENFVNVLNGAIAQKIAIYTELIQKFPASAYQFEDYILRANNSKELLARAVKEY